MFRGLFFAPAPKAETMAQLIARLTDMCDQRADMYRDTKGSRTYGNKFHRVAKLLADAQKLAKQEGI